MCEYCVRVYKRARFLADKCAVARGEAPAHALWRQQLHRIPTRRQNRVLKYKTNQLMTVKHKA